MSDNLTARECQHIDERALCPDCKLGQLLLGPRGGMCLNVRCDYAPCHHEFNIALERGRVVHGERLNRDAPEFYSGACLAVIHKPEER